MLYLVCWQYGGFFIKEGAALIEAEDVFCEASLPANGIRRDQFAIFIQEKLSKVLQALGGKAIRPKEHQVAEIIFRGFDPAVGKIDQEKVRVVPQDVFGLVVDVAEATLSLEGMAVKGGNALGEPDGIKSLRDVQIGDAIDSFQHQFPGFAVAEELWRHRQICIIDSQLAEKKIRLVEGFDHGVFDEADG